MKKNNFLKIVNPNSSAEDSDSSKTKNELVAEFLIEMSKMITDGKLKIVKAGLILIDESHDDQTRILYTDIFTDDIVDAVGMLELAKNVIMNN